MKKLILSAAIILGGFTTFAQTTSSVKTDSTKTEAVAKTDFSPKTIDDNYKEIKLEDVPSSVILAEKTAQPSAVIEKAYINENKEYKLDIVIDNQRASVYTDAKGNLKKK